MKRGQRLRSMQARTENGEKHTYLRVAEEHVEGSEGAAGVQLRRGEGRQRPVEARSVDVRRNGKRVIPQPPCVRAKQRTC